MAKTYSIKTTLDGKGAEVGLRQLNSVIKSTAAEGNALNKSLKVSGNMSAGIQGANKLKSALQMAEDRSKGLSKALNEAKLSNASSNTIADLTAKLARSNAEAQHLKTSLAGIDDEGKKGGDSMLSKMSQLGNSMNLLNPIIGAVKSGLSTVKDLAIGFGSGFIEQFDAMQTSSLTLKNTLADGEKGLKDYNKAFEDAPPLVRAQKKELDQFAATISSYSKTTGKEAFEIANAVNAVGDSVGAGMEAQQGFTVALGQAMTAGKLMAQDFNQMSQTALGTQFKGALIDAANEMQGVKGSTEDMAKAMQDGSVKVNQMNAVFGSDWRKNMAAAMQAQSGVKTSTSMVNAAMKDGSISAEMYAKVLGEDYLQKLTDASNAQEKGAITSENFRAAMEAGTFDTETLNLALDKFIAKGNELPQTFNTFGQVREAVKNGFFTGAVEAFMEQIGYAQGDLNEFGEAATNFATSSGAELGKVVAIAAEKVQEFIEANGGIEGVFQMLQDKSKGVIEGFKGMASNILTVAGNVLLATGSSSKELEAMGFDVNKLSGFVTGWSGNTKKMQGAQQSLAEEAKKSKNDFGLLGKIYDNLKGDLFNVSKASKDSENKLRSQSDGAYKAQGGLNKLDGSAKDTSRSLNNIPSTTVYVDTSSARNQLSYLNNSIDRTNRKLSSVGSRASGYTPLGGRDDNLRLDPLLATDFGAMRTSKAYGGLEFYNATTAAGRVTNNNTSHGSNFGEGAIQIIVNGGNTNKAVEELEAKLRRLGIRIS